jgi:hypothetical protein
VPFCGLLHRTHEDDGPRPHGRRSRGDDDLWAGDLRPSLLNYRPRYSPSLPLPSLLGGRLGAQPTACKRSLVLPLTSQTSDNNINTV